MIIMLNDKMDLTNGDFSWERISTLMMLNVAQSSSLDRT